MVEENDFPLLYRATLDYNVDKSVKMSTGLIIYLSNGEIPDDVDNEYETDLYYLPIYMCKPGCRIKPNNLMYLKIKNGQLHGYTDNDYNLSIGDKINNLDGLTDFFRRVSNNMRKPNTNENDLVLKQLVETDSNGQTINFDNVKKFILLCKISNNLLNSENIVGYLQQFKEDFSEDIKKMQTRFTREQKQHPNYVNHLIKNIMSEYYLSFGSNSENELPKAQNQQNLAGLPASQLNTLGSFGLDDEFTKQILMQALQSEKVFRLSFGKDLKYYDLSELNRRNLRYGR